MPSPRCDIAAADYQTYLKGIESGEVDLILTDPPYAISKPTGFAKVKTGVQRFAVSMDFGEWDHQEIDLHCFAQEAYRVLRKGGTCIVWYDIWKITPLASALQEAGFSMLRLIVWNKTNPVPLNSQATYLSNSREIAVMAVKQGKPTFHGQYETGDYELPIPRHNGNRVHPTQKPLNLFEKLIEKHSNAGDIVCDPFLGSGTTAVAAKRHKRHFIGCDIDAKYAEIAQKRVAQEAENACRASAPN